MASNIVIADLTKEKFWTEPIILYGIERSNICYMIRSPRHYYNDGASHRS